MQTLCVKNLTWKNTTYNNKTTKNQTKHTRRILILKKKNLHTTKNLNVND